MRNLALKICAVMLVVWYFMSIIGFGVHTCMGSGHSFVTTFVSDTACEEIHPDHRCPCSHHCCGHEEGESAFVPASCCSDDFVVLTLTGTVPSSENDFSGCHSGYCPFSAFIVSDVHTPSVRSEIDRISPLPDSGPVTYGNAQSVLSIWRI